MSTVQVEATLYFDGALPPSLPSVERAVEEAISGAARLGELRDVSVVVTATDP